MTKPGWTLGRRDTVLGLAGILAAPGCAHAQAQRASMPCPSRVGDIVGLTLEGHGGQAGSVVVFGQAFKPGDLPADKGLQARRENGEALTVQVDILNRHPDGSARMAVITLAAPALNNGQAAGVMLSAGAAPPAGTLDETLWGRHRAMVEVTGPAGESWTLELLPAGLRGQRFQSGPLALQGRVEAMVPSRSAGGVNSLRVVADIAVQAGGAVQIDAWFRNDIAMRGGGGTARYRARLVLDGKELGRLDIPRQPQYTGWGRQAVVAPLGQPPYVRHDVAYLADAGAIARYDVTTGVDEAILARMAGAMAAPDWATPFSPRGITQDMSQTGGRSDIGPATQPQVAWLMTGDSRAAAFALGQAEAAGSIPWHLWDPSGGSGQGGWLDARRWPRLWTDPRGGPPPGGLSQPIPGDGGWSLDSAHQPDLSFVPFLLTGRRAFLDGLQAQAAWCVVSQWPEMRGHPANSGPAEGLNVVRANQVRGAAWSLRQLDNASWASPERDPNLPYLRTCSDSNWAWVRSQLPAWSNEQGELRGCIPGVYGVADVLPPWQQDYFASTAAAAARRGQNDAMAVLSWMSNFLAGRFLSAAKGFDPRDGVAYLIAGSSKGDVALPLRSWAATGQAMRARGLSNGPAWRKTEGDYAQLALQTLAALVDVTGAPEARAAHAWLSAAGAPFTRQQDFRSDPLFNIVPRGAGRCSRS
jgi:hypothetical protein